ncbi:MAG TPA: pyridoxal phosphate-dependent aminotransferase [Vicinamibacterales bacterium]|nr:pyridoxal phosphate-dependent aminotransferase [Vicinamibacterales bacterium]
MQDDVISSAHSQSRRLASVQAPVIPIVGRWTAETSGTISLGQGVVSYEPPLEALDAARKFGGTLADHRYGPVEGLQPLVDAIEAKLAAENGIRVRPNSRVLVTAGGNQAFMNAVLAITDPDDEVILPTPYYFNHEMAVVIAGAKAVGVPTTSSYQLDVDAIAAAIGPRTRAVVTVSPNNPTGVVYPADDLRAINALCRDRGIFHIHDEAYEYFTYGDVKNFSPGSIDGSAAHTISLYSLSKAYGMASWRIGYMVIPAALNDAVNKIQDTILICPPAASQHAALAALKVGRRFARAHVDRLDVMRRAIADALGKPDVPCELPSPDGAFYYLVRVHSSMDSMRTTERLIKEHRVATIPGSAFADSSPCSVRISYGALDSDSIVEGLRRLVEGLRALA